MQVKIAQPNNSWTHTQKCTIFWASCLAFFVSIYFRSPQNGCFYIIRERDKTLKTTRQLFRNVFDNQLWVVLTPSVSCAQSQVLNVVNERLPNHLPIEPVFIDQFQRAQMRYSATKSSASPSRHTWRHYWVLTIGFTRTIVNRMAIT